MITGASVGTAVIAAAIATFLTWRKKAPTTAALLWLVVSASITSGFFNQIQHATTDALERVSGTLTTQAFGVGGAVFIAVIVVAWFVHDLHPQNKANRTSSGLAVILPPMVASIPGAAGALLVSLLSLLVTITAMPIQAIFGG